MFRSAANDRFLSTFALISLFHLHLFLARSIERILERFGFGATKDCWYICIKIVVLLQM